MPPFLSFVIPVYNRKAVLPYAIESILKSQFQDFEVILIDDASTDGTKELCEQYSHKDPRFHTIALEQNRGPGYARNCGIAIAKGLWIYFLDSDDTLLEHALPPIVQKLKSLPPSIPMTVVDSVWINEKNSTTNKSYYPPSFQGDFIYSTNEYISIYSENVWLPLWNCIFLTSFLKENNIQCPELYNYEDCVFMCHCLMAAEYISIFHDSLVAHQMSSPDSLSLARLKKSEDVISIGICEWVKLYFACGADQQELRCAIYQAIRTDVITFGIANDIHYHEVPFTPVHLIHQMNENLSLTYIKEMIANLFSSYFQELLGYKLCILPASTQHKILASRIIENGGNVVALFDNLIGTPDGVPILENKIKIYTFDYVNHLDSSIRFFSLTNFKGVTMFRNQLRALGFHQWG